MSKIKFNQEFKNLEGTTLFAQKECCILKTNGELANVDGVLITKTIDTPKDKLSLKKICIDALLADYENDEPGSKADRYILFQRFNNANGWIELTGEELVLVKTQIEKSCSTFIMGQAHAMLEGK